MAATGRIGICLLSILLAGEGTVMAQSGDQPVSNSDRSRSQPAVTTGVTGTVLAADGTPVVGAAVLVKSLDKPAPAIPDMAAGTDAQGRYVWRLPPGRYELNVVPLVGASMRLRVTVTAGRVSTLNFHLGK